MKGLKTLLRALLILVLVIVVAAVGLVGYLSVTEYRPEDVEPVEVAAAARRDNVRVSEMLKVVTFNTGYAALSRDEDFFMDGGKKSRPDSKAVVESNMSGILSALSQQDADIYLL